MRPSTAPRRGNRANGTKPAQHNRRSQSIIVRAATSAREGGQELRVVIAGGGIGGLAAAIACEKRGMNVTVLEKTGKFRKFGGPIQLAGNALGALHEISPKATDEVMRAGCVTGDRINGLLDGKSGRWYCRFDTRAPSNNAGLPLTLVLHRSKLQQILMENLAPGTVKKDSEVVKYLVDDESPDGPVTAILKDGSQVSGDVLIAADGIHSAVRRQLKKGSFLGDDPVFSGYRCYTAVANYEPKDVDTVGYQVFLGYQKYFVSSDVGGGQCQWYAFEATDSPPPRPESDEACEGADGAESKKRLLELFDQWCPQVKDRLSATLPEDIEFRPVFDRRPTLSWVDGHVALLGDSAHAMQPNLGQGGCQALEDAQTLGEELEEVQRAITTLGNMNATAEDAINEQIKSSLMDYQNRRMMRAAAVMGLARLAATMTTTYRDNLGESPYDFYPDFIKDACKSIEPRGIPHPGRMVGQIAMMTAIGPILAYLTSGGDAQRLPDDILKIQKARKINPDAFRMKGFPGVAT